MFCNIAVALVILFSLFAPEGAFIGYMDSGVTWQLMFQDPATPVMEGIVNLHNDIMFIIVWIGAFTTYMMGRCIQNFDARRNSIPDTVTHGTVLEVVWTVTPAIILMIMAVPSFALLYSIDEIIDPAITIKAVGHQWYWSYEYTDYENGEGEGILFDSYMIPDDSLAKGALRLLEVDNRVILPVDTHIRVIITAADVLHCWGIPSLGIKLDACPGRLNQTSMFIKREGIYYGQCSEICGVNHGFMPIVVEAVSLEDYANWVSAALED
jgi:cytochrome c oxidase subunit 2